MLKLFLYSTLMTNTTENKESTLRGVPILLVIVFLAVARLLHLEGWLYYVPLTIVFIINLIILYKLRKEISRKYIVVALVTIGVVIAIGAYYYFSIV